MESKLETALNMCYESQHAEGLQRVLQHARDSGWADEATYAPLLHRLALARSGDPPGDYNELFLHTILGELEVEVDETRALVEASRAALNRGAARQAVGCMQKNLADSVLIPLLHEQSRDFVQYLVSCFQFKLEEYLAEFSEGEDRRAASLVPELLDCFPDYTEDQLLALYDEAADGTVKQLLAQRLGVLPGRRLPYPPVNKFFLQLPNPREALDTELHKADDPERAVREYSIAPFYARCLMLGRYLPVDSMKLLQREDAYLTSHLGPVNTLYDANFDIRTPTFRSVALGVEFASECDKCAAYGGCRQFACTCFEVNALEEDDEDYDAPATWFTGECQLCKEEIPEQYAASRVPLSHGGWKGCFCSPECMALDNAGAALLELIEENTLHLLNQE